MVAVSTFGLNVRYAINEFVILDLSVLVGVVNGVEESLVDRTPIEDNRIVLIESIIECISNNNGLSIGREVIMHNSANKRLCYILLDKHSFIHPEWVIIHRPATCLFCLVCEHSYAFRLCVVCKGTQESDEAEH